MESINLYCDESNHLFHNENKIMTLGYIACTTPKVREANVAIRAIKEKHGLKKDCEIKWTKVSKGKIELYKDLIEFFFQSDFLQFRCVVADKEGLDYERFQITHDDWYYRMYYLLLGKSLEEYNKYNIYIDIKDTCSNQKVKKLKNVLNNSYYDFSSSMIMKVQQIHSHEVELLQLSDLFIGAIGYCNNGLQGSDAKLAVVETVKRYSNSNLTNSSPLSDKKFNIFVWEAK